MSDEPIETTLANAEDSNMALVATPPAVIEAEPSAPQPKAVWNEAFMWRAVYSDGTMWSEIDSSGNDWPWDSIDQSRLVGLELVPVYPHLKGGFVSIKTDQGVRPIFFRRRAVMTTPDGVEVGRLRAYCLGWQKTIEVGGEKRNVASYNFFFEDGSVLITDDADSI